MKLDTSQEEEATRLRERLSKESTELREYQERQKQQLQLQIQKVK